MKIQIAGAWQYAVKVAAEPIRWRGRKRMGLWVEGERVVLVSPDCPPRCRLQVVLHEAGEAWLAHCGGVPAEKERLLDLVATFAAASHRWLSSVGGEPALLALGAGQTLGASRAVAPLRTGRACGVCGGMVAAGSVERTVSVETPGVFDLCLYCEGCGHLMRWQEAAEGGALGEARYERGEAVGAFLARHPEMGVALR